MNTIWITGAGGLIGSHLLPAASRCFSGAIVRGLVRGELDLTNFADLERAFLHDKPDLIFHCAAMSRSPECQDDPVLARKNNVEVTKYLADLAADARLFFFSSDLVFDGRKGNYLESDSVNPLSVYAETKVEAEQYVLRNSAHTVVRTSLNGGRSPSGDRGFDEQMKLAWKAGKILRLFKDEFRCPIRAEVTAAAVCELAQRRVTGTFHVAGADRVSRWQIGELLAASCPELNPRIEPALLAEYKGAPRSPDTSLNCLKAQALLSFPLSGCRAWLATPQP